MCPYRLTAAVLELIIAASTGYFIFLAADGYAKQEQTKPEIRQFDTQKTVSVGSTVPPCLRHLSPGDRPQFVFRSADGTVIIIGSEDVRKRC